MSDDVKNEVDVDVEQAVKDFCKEMSDSMLRVEAEKDFQKDAINNLHEKTKIEKGVLKFCARTFHKQDFEEKQERITEEQQFYENIFGSVDRDVGNEGEDYEIERDF